MPLPAESYLYVGCIYVVQEVGRVVHDRVIESRRVGRRARAEHAGLPTTLSPSPSLT